MRKRHDRENKALKLLIHCAAYLAAGVVVFMLFMLFIWYKGTRPEPQAEKAVERGQQETIEITTPKPQTKGSIRVFDYDGCCIYAYYGEIEIRNDGGNGKEIDIVCAGYLEGYEEHKKPEGTGESEASNE